MNQSLLRKHMPELDFWRGLAIASVLLYHGIYWSQFVQPGRIQNFFTQITVFGWLGVNLFFVLSGFLITGILLDSKEKPHYFGPFYKRRAQRILPAYLLCLLLLGVAHLVSGDFYLQALTFTANYPNLFPAAKSYGPLWSLSVEEQFYLVWPLVVLFTSRRALVWICFGVLLVEPVLRIFMAMHGDPGGLVHAATFLIADGLVLGALGAIFFRSRYGTLRNAKLLSGGLLLLAVLMFAFGIPHGILHRTNLFGAGFQTVPFNILFAAAIFGSITLKPAVLNSRLARPIQGLGNISYGVYLYHYMMFELFDAIFHEPRLYGRFGLVLLRAFVCITCAILFAWISRYTLEEYFLRRRPSPVGGRSVEPAPAKEITT